VFGIFPVLDQIFAVDPTSPPTDVIKWLEQDQYYRYCTYAFLPLLYITLAFSCYLWAHGGLSVIDKIGLALSQAMVSGVAIADAHELGHKREKLERWFAKIALAPSGYGHFYIEHNRGHHVRVSTPEDPASARMGEGYYAFLPRTVIGSARSAYKLEAERLRRAGKSFFSPTNDVLNAQIMTVGLYAVLLGVFGIGIAPYLVLSSVVGFCLLEIVNYIEHYGLGRQKREDGRYERCAPAHSWNSSNTASNVLLYHLQRHSDHHANPVRRYQALQHLDEAPQLPTGYAGMILLASCPPLWKKYMDRRLMEHYEGDITRPNIKPSKRAKYYARYGATV
jgi:alkane 1-monooxygenase